jgi:hypothetical protein
MSYMLIMRLSHNGNPQALFESSQKSFKAQ